eukprot:scaffold52370_cov48-Phaeocystis_antarctica.AAC.3
MVRARVSTSTAVPSGRRSTLRSRRARHRSARPPGLGLGLPRPGMRAGRRRRSRSSSPPHLDCGREAATPVDAALPEELVARLLGVDCVQAAIRDADVGRVQPDAVQVADGVEYDVGRSERRVIEQLRLSSESLSLRAELDSGLLRLRGTAALRHRGATDGVEGPRRRHNRRLGLRQPASDALAAESKFAVVRRALIERTRGVVSLVWKPNLRGAGPRRRVRHPRQARCSQSHGSSSTPAAEVAEVAAAEVAEPQAEVAEPAAAEDSCQDGTTYGESCPSWAAAGECEANAVFMLAECRLSCGCKEARPWLEP